MLAKQVLYHLRHSTSAPPPIPLSGQLKCYHTGITFFLLIYFIVVWGGGGKGYIVAFTKILTILQIHHPLPLLSSPVPGVVSTGLIFPFTYTCTQYLHHIHPPMPFPHLLPLPVDYFLTHLPVYFLPYIRHKIQLLNIPKK
jgi:hypothetical protein